MKKSIKPFNQGDLDSLCGLYSLVNIAHYLIGPFNQKQAEEMMNLLIDRLDDTNYATEAFKEGIGLNGMAFLIKNVLYKEYGIHYSKPFHKGNFKNMRGSRGVINELALKINFEGNIALISLEGMYSHWSIVYKVTRKSLICFDSDGIRWLSRKNILMAKNGTKTHIISPHHCYLFYVP